MLQRYKKQAKDATKTTIFEKKLGNISVIS